MLHFVPLSSSGYIKVYESVFATVNLGDESGEVAYGENIPTGLANNKIEENSVNKR